jgi:hypothetical protein
MVFNINPLLENVMSKLEKQSGLPLSMLGSFMGDVNVSLSQIEEVIGQDLVTFSDQGISLAIMGGLVGEQNTIQDFEITYLKSTETEQALLGTAAYYYEISIPENDTKLILGIPKGKSDKKISCYTQADGATWKITADYEISDVGEIEMPQATVSDKTIDFLKKLYGYWKDSKQEDEQSENSGSI